MANLEGQSFDLEMLPNEHECFVNSYDRVICKVEYEALAQLKTGSLESQWKATLISPMKQENKRPFKLHEAERNICEY